MIDFARSVKLCSFGLALVEGVDEKETRGVERIAEKQASHAENIECTASQTIGQSFAC